MAFHSLVQFYKQLKRKEYNRLGHEQVYNILYNFQSFATSKIVSKHVKSFNNFTRCKHNSRKYIEGLHGK